MMFVLLVAAAAANVPERHYFNAAREVNNALTCAGVSSTTAGQFHDRLTRLETLARRRGLGADIDRQRKELKDFYMSALLIRCAGGKEQALGRANAALRALDSFIQSHRKMD